MMLTLTCCQTSNPSHLLDFTATDYCHAYFLSAQHAQKFHYLNDKRVAAKKWQNALQGYLQQQEWMKTTTSMVLLHPDDCSNLFRLANATTEQTQHQLISSLLNAGLQGLDPHSFYFEPAQASTLERSLQGKLSGKGLILGYNKTQRLALQWLQTHTTDIPDEILDLLPDGIPIAAVLPKSSASKVGIQPGDEIIAIDQQAITPMNQLELWRKLQTATEIPLMVQRQEKRFSVTVADSDVNNPPLRRFGLQQGVLYVQVAHFNLDPESQLGVAAAMIGLLERLPAFQSVIVDVQDNPGGDVQAATDFIGLWGATKPIVCLQGQQQTCYKSNYAVQPRLATVPLLLLANQQTASAAEITLLGLKAITGAPIIGETSYGKGSAQELWRLTERTRLGGIMLLTTSLYQGDGKHYAQKYGVAADIVLSWPSAEFLEDELRQTQVILSEADYGTLALNAPSSASALPLSGYWRVPVQQWQASAKSVNCETSSYHQCAIDLGFSLMQHMLQQH